MATQTQNQSTNQNQNQNQNQQKDQTQIDSAVSFIQKRLQEAKPAQLILRTSECQSQKELEGLFSDESIMKMLTDKLSGLDIKMLKVRDPADPKQEALEFMWSDEGSERFDVPEEEEAEEEPRTTGGGNGNRRTSGGQQQRNSNRGFPRPLLEQPKVQDISQIQNFSDVLKNITIQRIIYENWTRKNLVLVNSNQPIERALSRINTHNVHSLPVVDANTGSKGSVMGVIDILDIISALSESWETNTTRSQRVQMLFTPISELLSSEKPHPPTHLMSIHTTLHDAIKQMATARINRVLIVERQLDKIIIQQAKPEEVVLGLLTQSDIIRFAAENLMWIEREPLFQKTLRQVSLGQRKPIIVQPDVLAYQAFKEIHNKEGREGVALVDNDGKLIANISASNIKGMTRANIQLLYRPLTDFLARDRKRGWWQLPITTTLDTTLENVLLQFVGAKVHRMYIVDDDGKPVGEVSISDIVRQLGLSL
jgi:CBS domain-containing protein